MAPRRPQKPSETSARPRSKTGSSRRPGRPPREKLDRPGGGIGDLRPAGEDSEFVRGLQPILNAARELTRADAAAIALVPRTPGHPAFIVSAAKRREGEAAASAASKYLAGLTAAGFSGRGASLRTRPAVKALKGLFGELRSGGEVLGVLAVFHSTARGSSAHQRETVQSLANLAVLCLEHGEFLHKAWRQTSHLGQAYESASKGPPLAALSEVLEALVEGAAHLTSVRGAALYLPAESDQGLHLRLIRGQGEVRFPESILPSRLPESAADAYLLNQDERRPGSGSGGLWVLPLRWGKRNLGALVLGLRQSPEEAPTRHVQMARLLAAQAANALGVSAFVEAERRERQMAEALQEASQAIDRELDIGEVLDRILEQVIRAFSCDAANFMSYEGDISRVLKSRGYESFGISPDEMSRFTLEAPKYENLRRLIAGEAVTVADTRDDPEWVYRPGLEWLRSWAGVPVRYGDEILGFVMLDSATPGAFDDTSSRRLMAFASHAAAAMHNARLFQRLREEHERLQQVNSIGRHFAGSLSTDEIIESLLYASLGAVGGVLGLAYLRQGPPEEPLKLFGRFPPGLSHSLLESSPENEALVRQVEVSRMPVARTAEGLPTGASTIAFPIATGDRIWGVVILWLSAPSVGSGTWSDVFAAVGQQAGLAISNAVEHGKVQRRLAEMTLLQRVVGSIARRLEVGAMLAELTEQLQGSLGFPVVQVYMRDGDEYSLRHYSGPRPVVDRASIQKGIVGRVVRTGKPSFLPDVRLDPDYMAGLVGTRAEITVPIIIDRVTIGALNVETSEPAQLDDDAYELLTLLADQLSIALQNASLFEAAQLNVENLETRVRERTAQLEAVLEQAVAAERVKAQFVADVSHELRTPLTNIGLYLELLELSDDARRAEYMSTLRRETDRLGRLIEQLLSMSHLDTGQVQIRPQATDLNSLLQVLTGDRARMITRRGLRLDLQPEPNLPLVDVDPQYIMQVLTNLLSNATNYTTQGGRISLETATQEREGQTWVTFTVRDTGPGIPDDELSHVFDRFYRGGYARSSGISGTGLGLPISREIVERHGGRITLETKVGEGSAFTVWLPLAGVRATTPAA
jgi:signal transduction histidine kinase